MRQLNLEIVEPQDELLRLPTFVNFGVIGRNILQLLLQLAQVACRQPVLHRKQLEQQRVGESGCTVPFVEQVD